MIHSTAPRPRIARPDRRTGQRESVRGLPFAEPARVSVLVPLYNYGRYLPEAVGSALAQRGVDVEVVVVDDLSTDDSLAVARGLAEADPRVRVIASAVNRGPVASVLTALDAATGEFTWYLDADDVVAPDAMARAVDVARAFPSVGLVYGHPVHFLDGTPLPPARSIPTDWLVWNGADWLWERCRTGLNVITSPEVLVRRSVLDRVGGPRDLPHTYDMELWLRIAAASDIAYVQGVDQAWHREHDRSRSSAQVTPLVDLRERLRAFQTFFADPVVALPDAAVLERMARRALAAGALEKAAQYYDGGRDDRAELEEFLNFARAVTPDASRLPGWDRLLARLDRGRGSTRYSPRFVVERLLRRLDNDRSWRRWHAEGSF